MKQLLFLPLMVVVLSAPAQAQSTEPVTPHNAQVSGTLQKIKSSNDQVAYSSSGTDIRAFGARFNASEPTTCATKAGSPLVTIGSPQKFVNGSGIICVGA